MDDGQSVAEQSRSITGGLAPTRHFGTIHQAETSRFEGCESLPSDGDIDLPIVGIDLVKASDVSVEPQPAACLPGKFAAQRQVIAEPDVMLRLRKFGDQIVLIMFVQCLA
jgi:hypothetical protein